ncbi:MAG: DNA alkylation repair protein [Chitinophagales bacterium]|nr:DNA alkylation repair protein [Chitinophagales bacterium]
MNTPEKILATLKKNASSKIKSTQAYFGISNVNSYGLTTPQMRTFAKQIGTNHELALQLWKTEVHEARHIASMIADPKLVTEKMMEQWLKDFNSWDIVDGCCSSLFRKTPFAYSKAMEWTSRKKEFEKRAGFAMMAQLAVHDKKAEDKMIEQFFSPIISESGDERNFVKKAINWALRQIGKRNERLCVKAIDAAKKIHAKDDAISKWIAADALRELEKYLKEGKIRKVVMK